MIPARLARIVLAVGLCAAAASATAAETLKLIIPTAPAPATFMTTMGSFRYCSASLASTRK